jgi:hypothetical protein
MGGTEVSRDLGVEDPSCPESSIIVSESESLPRSEVSSVDVCAGAVRRERCGGEVTGERMRYRWPDEFIFRNGRSGGLLVGCRQGTLAGVCDRVRVRKRGDWGYVFA